MLAASQKILEEAKALGQDKKYNEASLLIESYLNEHQELLSPSNLLPLYLDLIDHLDAQGKYNEAYHIAEIGLTLASSINEFESLPIKAKIQTLLGDISRSLSKYDLALQHYEAAKSIYEKLGDKTGIASNIGNIGIIHSSQSNYQEALIHLQNALKLCEEIGNRKGMLKNYGNLSIIHFFLSDYVNAIQEMQEALILCEELGAKSSAAACIGNLGNMYMTMGDYHKALEFSMRSLVLEEESKNILGIAINTGNIGNIYLHLNDNSKALDYYQKALDYYKSIDNKSGEAVNTGNIGKVYLQLKDYDRTLECFKTALSLNESIGEKLTITKTLGDIGALYLELQDFNEAHLHLEKSLNLAIEIGELSSKLTALSYLGVLYSNKNYINYNLEKAIAFFSNVLNESKQQGLKDLTCKSSQALCNIYKSKNQWKDAFNMLEIYLETEKEMNRDAANKMAKNIENKRLIDESERDRQLKLARYKEQERILHNILPSQIADRMLEGETQIADLYEGVSVFFSDIVGFTKLSQNVSPNELVNLLNGLFSEFDGIAKKYGLEKIKTIGDAYMAASGIPLAQEDHAERAADFAIEIHSFMQDYKNKNNLPIELRIGLHCGKAVAGIIGTSKFSYDLWGDAVNTASRMESQGAAGMIHISEDFKNELSSNKYHFQHREKMEIKGKGIMNTFFLLSH